MVQYSEGTIFPWLWISSFNEVVTSWGTHDHLPQIPVVFFYYQRSSFAWFEPPSNSLELYELVPLLLESIQAQRIVFLQFDPIIEESCTFSHIKLQKVTSSDWPDGYYCMRIQHKVDFYPNFLHAEGHMLSTYLPILDLSFQSVHQSEGDKLYWNSTSYSYSHESFSKILR